MNDFDFPPIPSSFARQTTHIKRWVDHESVPTIGLASELMAWSLFATEGASPKTLAVIMRDAADLLADIYKDAEP